MGLFDQQNPDEELRKQILLRSLIGDSGQSYGKPMIGNEQTAGVARGLSNAADLFVGRKPQFPVGGGTKLAEAMALAKYKQDVKPEQQYFSGVDEQGNAIPVQNTNGMKPMPVGYSAPYQEAAKARGEVSRATVPLREAQVRSTEASVPLKEAQAHQFGLGNEILEKLRDEQSGGSGGITPGTTFTGGGVTVPLNPKMDADQASAISSVQTFKPQVEAIAKATREGIFNSMKPGMLGNIERTSRQAGVDSGIPMLTSADPKLQEVQGYLNSVRRYAFGEGGKNLTGTEKAIVDKLLNTMGKNDAQIISDHQKAIQIIQSKADIALGGRNAALQGENKTNDLSQMSDEELRVIAGIQ